MDDERIKAAPRKQPPDKTLARRERQAQALRQNLVRRKAQARDRTMNIDRNPAEGDKDEPPHG